MKIAIITCYKQPDYVRALVLRVALVANPENKIYIIKNRQLGLLRYPEVLMKLLIIRFKHRPDAYLLTFRGYEVLPAVNVITWPKPLIFDEFINPLEWLHEPRPERWARFVPKKVLRRIYRLFLRRSKYILADTAAHASYSAQLTNRSRDSARYIALPVSTDELLFKPAPKTVRISDNFKVFYYGNMLPLHGLTYILEAAIELKAEAIEFTLIGGDAQTAEAVRVAQAHGARIIYESWVDFKDLPGYIYASDLCLSGPFGGTVQASYVITGKTYQFLACGWPTLIGKNKVSELFLNKTNCLSVPQMDTAAIVETILWAKNNPEELENIGKNGRQLYETEFSNKIITKTLDGLLQRLD